MIRDSCLDTHWFSESEVSTRAAWRSMPRNAHQRAEATPREPACRLPGALSHHFLARRRFSDPKFRYRPRPNENCLECDGQARCQPAEGAPRAYGGWGWRADGG